MLPDIFRIPPLIGIRPLTPRAAPRISMRIPVKFSENGDLHEDHTLNISTGGMFIKTNQYIQPGKKISIEFQLNSQDTINVEAKIIWATEGKTGNEHTYARGLGVQFQNLPAVAKQQINYLVTSYREFP